MFKGDEINQSHVKGISLIDLQSFGRHANIEKNRTIETKHSRPGQLAGIEV